MRVRILKTHAATRWAPASAAMMLAAFGCTSTVGPSSAIGSGGVPGAGSGGAAAPSGSGGAAPATGSGGATTSTGSGGSGGGSGTGGRAGVGTGGAGTGGTTTTSGTGGLGAGGSGSVADICARWTADRANLSEGTWSGATATCTAGDLSADARANALRLVNLYRWLAALPAVDTDPTHNQQDQECALMMRANNMLSHEPPNTWTCWTQAGTDAAGSSNISGGQAVSSVDSYMIDSGNPTTIGHRRWMLSNSLGPIGIGGTDRSSCMWTLDGTGRVGKPWMAWPAAGTVPLQAIAGARGQTVDTTGWSIQSDTINLATAAVAVTVDGADAPVTVTQLLANYGSRYAIRFNPNGWTTQAGKTYQVAVTGVTPAINYSVQVISCP